MLVRRKPLIDRRRLQLPARPRVESIETEEFIDSIGDPALRITVTLAGDPEAAEFGWRELKPIEDAIFHHLRERGDRRFPYVRFAALAER